MTQMQCLRGHLEWKGGQSYICQDEVSIKLSSALGAEVVYYITLTTIALCPQVDMQLWFPV